MIHELSSATNQFVRDQALVTTGYEMIENFPARTAGVAAEFRVIEIMEPPVSLCDVRSRRTRGPQQLITEPVSFVLGQSWDDLAGNKPAQITTSLPALEILKAADRPRFNSFHFASLPLSPTRRHYYLINE